jgi:hypothetical protein
MTEVGTGLDPGMARAGGNGEYGLKNHVAHGSGMSRHFKYAMILT